MASSTEINAIPFASHVSASVLTITPQGAELREDQLASEEPLEIRVGHASPEGFVTSSLAITMRTPGDDCELAAGFLLSEGIISAASDLTSLTATAQPASNTVRADLSPSVVFSPARQARHFYTTSSCGVCGKASLDALSMKGFRALPRNTVRFPAPVIHSLPAALESMQHTFHQTGGLHAAALFSNLGSILSVYEDVGRHNALDKLLGAELLSGRVPLHERLVLVSGRASFELVQKCIAAGVVVLAAVGAPSSLAVDLAREFDLTLIGFVRSERFNIYSGEWRIHYEVENAG